MEENKQREEFEQVKNLAKQGDAEALFKLGSYHFRGLLVEKDVEKAADLHIKAFQAGFSEVCFEKDGEEFTPTLIELIEIYKQATLWRIRHDYYHYHEYYAGSGDDYSYQGIDDYCIFSPYHKLVKKVIVGKENEFAGVAISARVYIGSLTPTLFVDGTLIGSNEFDEMCPRMDGPEDWGYRDKYTLVKEGQAK